MESSISKAKVLRLNETEPEQILWSWLRKKQLGGYKFRRQEPIGKYIVDFVCFDKRLIIEVDGGQHNEPRIIENDEKRTEWFESQGFKMLRFWNNEVKENIEGVMIKIADALE
jgi:very-short-patch-repair endonuclease